MWSVTPGTIDEQAIGAFTYGGCAALAASLHDATGWPLVAVVADDGLELHFMIRHPGGDLIDITGRHSEDDVLLEYEFRAGGGATTLTDTTRLTYKPGTGSMACPYRPP